MRKKRMWNKTVKGSYSCMENAREIIKKNTTTISAGKSPNRHNHSIERRLPKER